MRHSKVVEGLTQVIQAVNRPERSRFPSHANTNRKCWYHGSNTHEIIECFAFLALANDKKTDELKKNGACFCCPQLGHLSRQCLNANLCNVVENGQTCNKYHHPLLHLAYREGSLFHTNINTMNDTDSRRDNVILMISSVPCNGQSLTAFWDSGSNTSLITRQAACRLRVQGMLLLQSLRRVTKPPRLKAENTPFHC